MFITAVSSLDGDIGVTDVKRTFKRVQSDKTPSPALYFGRDITQVRAFIYGMVTGANDKFLSSDAFIAACNRLGLDSPCPIITKRLGVFGNTEEMEKDFKRLLKKYSDQYPENAAFKTDPEILHPINEFKAPMLTGGVIAVKKKTGGAYNFSETDVNRPEQKLSGFQTMHFLKNN